jgi:uncharacterized protein (TIGR02246 family)
MTKVHDYEAIFGNVLAACEQGDVQRAAEFFAEDAVVVDYADPSVVHSGRAAIAALMQAFLEELPNVKFEITHLVTSGDRLAAEIVARAIPKGQLEPVELRSCTFDVFRGDKIVSEHMYLASSQVPGKV